MQSIIHLGNRSLLVTKISYLKLTILMFFYVCVNENSINNQVKKKRGNFIQAKLRIVTWETFSEALRTVLPVRSRRHSHIHFLRQRAVHQNDIWVFYIKFTKDI